MARAAEFFRGAERLAIIEIVRSLDEAAFAFRVAPNAAELLAQDNFRHQLLLGAASALRPLLERIRGTEGGVPWEPSSPARRPEFVGLAEEVSTQPVFERLGSRKMPAAQRPTVRLANRIELEGLTVEFV